jgi:hypothetical protein
MTRSWIAFALLSTVTGFACGGAQHPQQQAPEQGAVVNAVHTPIDLSAPLALDRAMTVALERHPISRPSGEPTAAERIEHERHVRHRAAAAYAAYLRTTMESQVRTDAATVTRNVLQAARARTGASALTPMDLNVLQLEEAQLRLDVRRAEHDQRLAQAVLNTELSRAPDAAIGPPSETEPTSIHATVDELVGRAMRQRQALGETVPEHVVRGEVTIALGRLEHLVRSWQIFEAETLPPATAITQGLQAGFTAGQLNVGAYVMDGRLAWQTRLERAGRFAEILVAAAELEWIVGEPLARVPIGH